MSKRAVSRRSDAPGFTLIELLVVIAIIGVLVALILPAVQSAREAANRTKCINNLKQLGLAAIEYHDQHQSLPSGWYCNEEDTTACLPYIAYASQWTGHISLLPNLEQMNLFNEMNFDLPPMYFDTSGNKRLQPENATSVRRSLDFFVCPSNRKAAAVSNENTTTPGTPRTSTTIKVGPSDYRWNMAAGRIPDCTRDSTLPYDDCNYYDNGVAFQNSGISFSEITDGTSFTVMMGEVREGTWPEASNCCVRTAQDRTMNRALMVNGKPSYIYWSSMHNGRINFLKCDGSVSSLSYTMKKNILVGLMTRNGQEAISSDDL